MNLDAWNAFLTILGSAFSAENIAFGIQRGLVVTGFVLVCYAIASIWSTKPGTLLGYYLATNRLTAEAMVSAEIVGALEGKAEGLKRRVDLLLAELQARSKGLPAPAPGAAGAQLSVPAPSMPSPGAASPATPALPPVGAAAAPAAPSLPPIPPVAASAPPLPPMPSLPPLPPFPPASS